MNRKITFTVDPSAGQGDTPPRLLPRGNDDWVVARDQPPNVVWIDRVTILPTPPSAEEQVGQGHAELEAIAHALAGMRALLIAGAGAAELTPIVDDILNDVFDLHGRLV